MMAPRLSNDLEQAVQHGHGMLRVQGEHEAYIVMTVQAYREMAGVGTDQEMAESLRAIEEGLADIDAGRTRPFREVLAEMSRS
jgi:predicted transcriptional regulator